ncbi:MAG: MFS transporter [Dysgonamonadaceae bacterium]|nr:MFS transporter [Dysgonamonadaceae bacterium]MDD3309311.1 MFS transporter [Dysgonamonadaceae bacterium]MDD3900621.1 MFS transporter [Dysgonamonadaceae bacterium]MDD4399081.1 MFS transporter [Dysgonamonadaceae bacterium]MEA5081462.1 MFS transporter [Dysgonamonadaceae bacterium]
MSNNSQINCVKDKSTTIKSMIILALLFFIFGLVSWVNTILIPYFQLTLQLSRFQSYLVTFAFYIAYLIMSIPSSFLLNKVGYKKGMMLGLWCMSLGALLFVPAAYWRIYQIFLLGLFLLGVGLAILQSAANPYVTIVGPIESAAKRMSIVGTGNKLAGVIANLIFAAVVIRESDRVLMREIEAGVYTGADLDAALDTLIQGVMTPYFVLAITLFIFGIVVRYSPLPELDPSVVNKQSKEDENSHKSIFQYPALILGVIAMFFHIGTQMVGLGTSIQYAGSMGESLAGPAHNIPSYTMSLTFIGYFIGIIFIPKYLNQRHALLICASINLVLSTLIITTSGTVNIFGLTTDISLWYLVMMGLPNALLYAGIWPLAINGLGKHTNLGSAFLVMALCGSAIMPIVYNSFVEVNSFLSLFEAMKKAYWILIPCFAYIVWYGAFGYKIKSWKKVKNQ